METTTRIETYRAAAASAAKSAREIMEKAEAEGRRLDGQTLADYQHHMKTARQNLDLLKSAKADEAITAQARALAREIDGPAGPDRRGGRKAARGQWAKATAERMSKVMTADVDGQKALISGSIGVPVPIETDIVAMSEAPRTLLELIPVRPLTGGFGTGNSYNFLRQTVRNHQATVVPDGAVKPTSVYTVQEIEDRVRVIATLSEPVPERYLADYGNLEDFLASEMEAGIQLALEDQVLNGDGTGENLTGILATSGLITQAFATDRLTSIRKGLTALQVYGITPTALVLHPTDLEALDLLRADGATGAFLLGDPAGDSAANIWRVPRIPSTAVTPGTAILGDFDQAEIIVREDATLAVDRSGELFTKNLVVLRLEGRFGLAVKRPNAFVEIDLTA